MPQPDAARDWAARILIPLLFFAATAPTLQWVEFAGGSENIVVATAMEMRRSGHWVIPTLAGEKRLAKPPLAAWIAAVSIDRQTFTNTLSDDPETRDSAYRRLTLEIRWPALLCACITLALTYDLGRILGGRIVGVVAALVMGASYAFLRYARIASTDVQLALWVTGANLFLAQGLFENKRWWAGVGTGLAMALAFISKGPVALVQTIIPFILFFMVRQRSDKKAWPRRWLGPAIFGALVFALVAFPWFLYVAARSEAWATWRIEVLRKDPLVPSSNPFNYLTIFVLMLPWSAFFVVGLIRALGEAGQRPLPRMTYALFLLLAPILVMTFFRDRKERYLLPMVPAAAILTAHGLLALRDQVLAQRIRLPLIVHWVIVAGLGVVVPLMAAMKRIPGMLTVDGQAWFSWPLAGGLAVGCGALVAVGAYLGRGRIWGVIAPTVVVMLLMNPALMWAYGRSEAGRSEMKEFAFGIRQRYPVIPAYSIRAGRRPPEELSIYMNRTVQALADLSKLPPPAGPQLLFVFEDKKTAAPALPPYWVPVDSYRRGESVWQVYHHP